MSCPIFFWVVMHGFYHWKWVNGFTRHKGNLWWRGTWEEGVGSDFPQGLQQAGETFATVRTVQMKAQWRNVANQKSSYNWDGLCNPFRSILNSRVHNFGILLLLDLPHYSHSDKFRMHLMGCSYLQESGRRVVCSILGHKVSVCPCNTPGGSPFVHCWQCALFFATCSP